MFPFEKLNILIVDDSTELLSSLKSVLASLGVKSIHMATSGEEALTKLNEPLDLVICDQHMGAENMKGIDFLKEVRKSKSKEELPFIMLTSDGSRANIILLAMNGGNSFIVKPTSVEILNKKIQEVLANHFS